MPTDQPKVIYLKDYRVPDYLIEETHLTFDLHDEGTQVQARLVMRRNEAAGLALPRPPLVLDGQDLELLSLALDGQPLTGQDYQQEAAHLKLQPNADRFVLETCVRIHPETNTALEGLYQSGRLFCTQCEAEGFRKITYYLDRPDVMSLFTTTVKADAKAYPILLSNGNPIARGTEEDGRHWVTWQDPFKKPAYLFALVAGDLVCVEDQFTTCSGRSVALRIYVEPENADQCQHAMSSLKNAMRWDEEVYGREYDLDIFMIVAVNDFNMGAMENKGLNIFNASAVLAKAETATDAAHLRVESIVAHEYFHNWSGNRVTCRDWFQLSLKEGFTVYRDAMFSADRHSATVKRIEDVAYLRTHQFAEDAGPMAHPVRPASFIEISNFYTLTVYEKGAEVVGMLRTLLGAEGFRKGTDLYFERHDGQAVTCDDFVKAMEDSNGCDLTQFKRWYSQAGTPRLAVTGAYNAQAHTYTLTFRQSCPPTPDQVEKQPFVIPVAMGLLDPEGHPLPLQLAGTNQSLGVHHVLAVTESEQVVQFINVPESPIPSLLRNFSAPVKLSFPYTAEQLMFLMQHDTDGFNRWEAGQQLAVQGLQRMVERLQSGEEPAVDAKLIEAYRLVLANAEHLDQAMLAELLQLPSEGYLTGLAEVADPIAIHQARQLARQTLAQALFGPLWALYQRHRASARQTGYEASGTQIGRRAVQNAALGYLMLTERADVLAACLEQFQTADNMTERFAALAALVHSSCDAERDQALEQFANQFRDNPLVMDQWFSVQASSPRPYGLERVQALMQHPAFTLKNPNKVRALIGAFAGQNHFNFHQANGAGYRFLADQVIVLNGLNPQIAARQLAPLTRWRKYDAARQELMKSELERIVASGSLSADVYEVVTKSLT